MSTKGAPARLLQINISQGGIPKLPVERGHVNTLGIEDDHQRNRKYHGGPQQALLLIAAEVIDALRAEGWPVFYGGLGENLTTYGLDHRVFRSGQRYRIGNVVLQLTKPRAPCASLHVYGPGIQTRIFDRKVKALNPRSPHWGESGFYAAVIHTGEIRRNDIIELLDPVV